MSAFENRTVIMSGASRGIGMAIAMRVAREGARWRRAKTDQPHPKLGARSIPPPRRSRPRAAGAGHRGRRARRGARGAAVAETVERFGGIDIVVNNASAINLAPCATSSPSAST